MTKDAASRAKVRTRMVQSFYTPDTPVVSEAANRRYYGVPTWRTGRRIRDAEAASGGKGWRVRHDHGARRRRLSATPEPALRQMDAEVGRSPAGQQHHDLRAVRRQRHEGHDRRRRQEWRQVAMVLHDDVRREGRTGHRQPGV